MQILKIFPLCR